MYITQLKMTLILALSMHVCVEKH